MKKKISVILIVALTGLLTGCVGVSGRLVTSAGDWSPGYGWSGTTVQVVNVTRVNLDVIANGMEVCKNLPPQEICIVDLPNFSGGPYQSQVIVRGWYPNGAPAGVASLWIGVSGHGPKNWETWEVSYLRVP